MNKKLGRFNTDFFRRDNFDPVLFPDCDFNPGFLMILQGLFNTSPDAFVDFIH